VLGAHPQQPVRRGAPADPQPTALAARQELLEPPRDRHARDERRAVEHERVLRVDPVAAGAQPASARDVRVGRVEDQLGERVLDHVA